MLRNVLLLLQNILQFLCEDAQGNKYFSLDLYTSCINHTECTLANATHLREGLNCVASPFKHAESNRRCRKCVEHPRCYFAQTEKKKSKRLIFSFKVFIHLQKTNVTVYTEWLGPPYRASQVLVKTRRGGMMKRREWRGGGGGGVERELNYVISFSCDYI